MAKIVIEIEDVTANGRPAVRATSRPSAEDLFKKIASYGADALTPAEAYASLALRTMRGKSKETQNRIIVPVPKIGRP